MKNNLGKIETLADYYTVKDSMRLLCKLLEFKIDSLMDLSFVEQLFIKLKQMNIDTTFNKIDKETEKKLEKL